MSIALVVNGVTYDYPEVDDTDWGPDATDWAAAITSGTLQKAGGLFQLLSELDFGSGFGVKSLYFKSRNSSPADAGIIRLAHSDLIDWRNNADSGNLSLGVSVSDKLQFNGVDIQSSISISDTTTIDLTLAGTVLSADLKALSIDNSLISNSAAIAYAKLNLASSILNSDLANMAQGTFKGRITGSGTGSPVDLTAAQATAIINAFVGDSGAGGTKGSVPAPAAGDTAAQKFLFADGTWKTPPGSGDVVGPASSTADGFARFSGTTGKLIKDSPATISNADVASAAAIAFTKMAALSTSKVPITDGSGFITASVVTTTELANIVGGTSAFQTQINAKLPTTISTTGDLIYSSSGTTASRLGIGSSAQYLKVVSGLPAWGYQAYRSVVTTDSPTLADEILTCSGASFTLTLPTAVGCKGKVFSISHGGTSLSQIYTLATTSSQTIGSVAGGSYALYTSGESVNVCSDGSNWAITGRVSTGVSTAYTPTTNGFGTTTAAGFIYTRVGDSIKIMGYFTAGTVVASLASIALPGGLSIDATKLNRGNTATADGSNIGRYTQNTTSNSGNIVTATATNANLLYFGNINTVASSNIPQFASDVCASNGKVSFYAELIPIVGFQP